MFAQAMLGAGSAKLVDIISGTAFGSSIAPGGGDAFAGVLFHIDGIQYRQTNGAGTVNINTWLKAGPSSNYEFRATLQAGSISVADSDLLNTWVPANAQWACRVSGTGVQAADLLIEVRHAASGVILDSCTWHLEADRGF